MLSDQLTASNNCVLSPFVGLEVEEVERFFSSSMDAQDPGVLHTMRRMRQYIDFVSHLKKVPPIECEFSVGDTVTYTNEYGVSFSGMKVVGFDENDDFYGRFIYLDSESYWFPIRPAELTLEAHKGVKEAPGGFFAPLFAIWRRLVGVTESLIARNGNGEKHA